MTMREGKEVANFVEARTCVAVVGLPFDAIVEMECIALCPGA